MAEQKTTPNDEDVDTFLARIADPQRRADANAICELMREATGEAPAMWGTSIVGFGKHRYVYDSGRSGDWFLVGFSPRKQNLTLYLGSLEGRAGALERLGKHSTGKGCLYVKRLSEVDRGVLRELVDISVTEMRARYAGERL